MDTAQKKQCILVIKHGALGDLIQSDGVLRDIRLHFKNAELILLTEPKFESLMSRCPHIDKIVTDSRPALWKIDKWFTLNKKLKEFNFDRVIDLQNSDRTALYKQFILSTSHWHGREQKLNGASGLHGQVSILEQMGITIHSALNPNIKWLADDVSEILREENILKPYIALIPGCSAQHPEKRWPYYSELADRLLSFGYDVVNILGPDERELANSLPGHSLIKTRGVLSWPVLTGVINSAHYVIGNDTGPSHIASCLDKPGLALFGGHTSAKRAEISRSNFKALQVEELEALSAEQVLSHASSFLRLN